MDAVADHYASSNLTGRILAAFDDAGIERGSIDADALASVDEFHLGGRAASEVVLDALTDATSLLDVGCGIGGFARLAARRLDADVTGIDLTPEFVSTASELSDHVGLGSTVAFAVGSALDLDVDDGSLDAITLLHVGMNIADKAAMFAEFGRVLRTGGTAVIYDIMRTSAGSITYPVPWASSANESFVDTARGYIEALESADLACSEPVDLRQLTLDTLAAVAARPPAAVNLGHLMGVNFPTMFSNLMRLVNSGVVAPTMIVATKD